MEITPTKKPSVMPKRYPEEKTTKVKNSTLGTERMGSFKTMAKATKTPIKESFLTERFI
jgi:hypothetical protein